MTKPVIKKFYLLISSLFIFVIHSLFVFARVKPVTNIAGNPSVNKIAITENPVSANPCILNIYDSLKLGTLGLSKQAYDYALKGFNYLLSQGKLVNNSIISIVDFSETSNKKRLFILFHYPYVFSVTYHLAILWPVFDMTLPSPLSVFKGVVISENNHLLLQSWRGRCPTHTVEIICQCPTKGGIW